MILYLQRVDPAYGLPLGLYFKEFYETSPPAAIFDLDGPTGRLSVTNPEYPNSPTLVPFLPPPHGIDTVLQVDYATTSDAYPEYYPEMRCRASAGYGAVDGVTGNLLPDAEIECMATATDVNLQYGGVSFGGNRELLMISEYEGFSGYQFRCQALV
ncbi:hypothetical protein PG997_012193 [Apiospora hydei]|uniref:Ubiquitin 3 binding protein But2 C-terminal domain-containing protein n=1 Tax=Apiospora hydei TaxID=1337664 RepID=A0ABR1V2N3_9PEZI